MANQGREKAHGTKWFKDTMGITISEHEGKMTDFMSLSTSPCNNSRCRKNCAVPGSICEECYAQAYTACRANLRKALEENGRILRMKVYEIEDFPRLNALHFRIESFGDLEEGEAGIRQARNYIRFAMRNPRTTFGWWTKNPDVLDEAIRIEGRPENIVFVISSLMRNQVRDVSAYKWVDIVFTCWDEEFLAQHPEIVVNCGKRQCLDCLSCYTVAREHGVRYVNEIVKKKGTKKRIAKSAA